MRKALLSLICFVALIPLPASAGLIHGSIREGGGPASKQPIEIVCPNSSPIKASTDDKGDYRVAVEARGKCELRVGDSKPATIFSSDDPVRYDFEIKSGKGPSELQRK
jgi:hypothetical protein